MPKRIEYESNIKEYGDDYIIYKDNSKYEGTIMKNENGDDRRHGYGLMTYSDGRIYEGDYKNNLKEGNGKLIFADGLIYEGEFKNNKHQGNLKAYDKNGNIVFDGTVNEKGESTGFMIHKDKSGNLYEGYIVNDFKEGKGKFTFENGNVYEGEFKDDIRNGYGKFTFANGNVYEGEFKDDMRHGKGTLYCKEIYDNGEVYEEIYEGYWKNDMKNGKGETTIKGYWRDNYVVSNNEYLNRNNQIEELKKQLKVKCRCNINSSDPYYQSIFPDDEVYTFY
jgi:hypothetical protein